MNIHTSKRAVFVRSFDRRNAVSAQEPKKFALSSQRKLSVLLVVGIVILSAKDCDMKPVGPGGGGGDPDPVYQHPLASTLSPAGPLSLARSAEVAHGVTLTPGDQFGESVAFAGDLDGGGGIVLAVGVRLDDTGGRSRGAIYLLSYNATGVLQSTKKIAHGLDETNGTADTLNTLAPALANDDYFGNSLANAGDLDGGGGTVLAVGSPNDDTGGSVRGAVYLLSFSASGNLTATTKIASGTDNAPALADDDSFGSGLANAGDLYGNGSTVLAVGALGSGSNKGAIHLLSFNASGALTGSKKIASGVDETTEGDTPATSLAPSLGGGDQFGNSIAYAGDLDGGGGTVLAVGALGDGTRGSGRGAVHLLSFNDTGSLQSAKKIAHATNGTNTAGSLAPSLGDGDNFGSSIANAGDLDGDGGTVLAVGAENSNPSGRSAGAIYLLSFSATGNLTANTQVTHGTDNGPVLSNSYRFGSGLASAGNLDGSGGRVLAVGGEIGDLSPTSKTGELQLLYFSPPAED